MLYYTAIGDNPPIQFMTKILKFLSGKKSIIVGIIITVSAYLGTQGVIDENTVVLIGTLCTVIFGSASIATAKMVYSK